MKRVFAIIIVLVLAIGMVGLFFASFLQGGVSPTATAPAVTGTPTVSTTPTPAPTPTHIDLQQVAQ